MKTFFALCLVLVLVLAIALPTAVFGQRHHGRSQR